MICSRSGCFASHVEVFPQADVGDDLAAHVGHVFAVGILHVLSRQLDALQSDGQRQHKIGLPDAHQQAVNDGQRERQA